jgi:GNAT superfamily N-acetyltransferase
VTSGGSAAGTASSNSAQGLQIRPIAPTDKQALAEGFEHLSDESRYRRFLSPHGSLSDAELRYFTEVDHHDHEALVAIDPQTGRGVGIARYIRSETDPKSAELAIAVADDWQRMGVGTRLATALSERAKHQGITAFTGLVLADNQLILSLARDLGEVRIDHKGHGTIEVTAELPREHRHGALASRFLRAFATGALTSVPVRNDPD